MKPYFLLPVLLMFALPAHAQQVTVRKGVSSEQIQQFMQQVQTTINAGEVPGINAEQQKKLQLAMAAGKIYDCTEVNVGRPRVEAFISDMQNVGKHVETLCKQGRAPEARALALATLKDKSNDPTGIAARHCYFDKKPEFEPLLNNYPAHEIANYERWAENPDIAAQEVREQDICKGTPQVMASPAGNVTSQPLQELQ